MESRSYSFWTILCHLILAFSLSTGVFAEVEGKTQILLIGDSTAEGSIPRILKPEGPHLETMMELLLTANGVTKPSHVINTALSGEFIRRFLDTGRYAKVAADLPGIDWIFIRYGLNDRAKRENFAENFPKDFKELIKLLRKDHPAAQIVLMTVIPFSNEEATKEINNLVRAVATEEKLEVLDLEPRYSAELEKGPNMLNYRRFPLEKVPNELKPLVESRVHNGSVLVMDNELDAVLGHLPGWFSDRHPNLAGYNVIADETIKWLAPKLKK